MDRTFLLLWNPKKWDWKDLASAVEQVAVAGICSDTWSVGNRSDLPLGSRVYLMRVGEDPKGLVGSGWCISTPKLGPHWDPARAALGQQTLKIAVEFDVLREQPVVELRELANAPFDSIVSWTPQSSGMELPSAVASALNEFWANRIDGLGAKERLPLEPPQNAYPEGALRRITINAYERDPRARKACIDHYGASCQVCFFSFGASYGEAFAEFIHVHHVALISELGENYRIDPIKDLRPVCPNCHAALHHRRVPYTIQELKELISNA